MPYAKVCTNLAFNEETGIYRLENVQLRYPHLFEPYKGGKYSAKFYMEQKTHGAALKHLIEKIKKEAKEVIGVIPSPTDRCVKDATLKDESAEGWYFLSASESEQPVLKNRNKTTIDEEEGDKYLYAGAKVTVLFKLWYQNNTHGKKANANLLAVQFVEHGERIKGSRADIKDDDFEDYGPVDDSGDDDFDGDGFDD